MDLEADIVLLSDDVGLRLFVLFDRIPLCDVLLFDVNAQSLARC